MRKRILVVERDEDILNVVTTILEGEGYLVSQSRTELGIVERVTKEKPDAIILDIVKPTPEGTTLCNAIKNTKSIKHIPVIVLSTHPNIKSSKIDCADDVISKPFDIVEIIKTVENHLLV
ncbi:MAG: response regulator [Sphingobacteriaceae bacterium]